jgi:hypothetical protein
VVLVSEASAQNDVSEQIWLDYNPRWTWPSGLELFGDAGVRTELAEQGWGRIVVRPGIRGPVSGRFRLAGGIGVIYTGNTSAVDGLEFRPFQGVSTAWPRGRVRLDHYARFEERFQFETATWSLETSFRFRYRLQAQIHWEGARAGAHWRMLAHIEGFLTIAGESRQFDEKVRLGVGIERGFGPRWRGRVDATWQKTGTVISGAPTDDIYLRIRVFHAWTS